MTLENRDLFSSGHLETASIIVNKTRRTGGSQHTCIQAKEIMNFIRILQTSHSGQLLQFMEGTRGLVPSLSASQSFPGGPDPLYPCCFELLFSRPEAVGRLVICTSEQNYF